MKRIDLDAERAVGEGRGAGVADAAAGLGELADAHDPGGGLLELADLVGELLQRLAQHLGVLEAEVDGAERDEAALVERAAKAEGDAVANCEEQHRGHPAGGAGCGGADLALVQVALGLVHAAQAVGAAAVGAHIVEAGEALLDQPVEVGGGGALGGHKRHREVAHEAEDQHREHGEGRERRANAPILAEEQGQGAHEQQAAADHAQHELREEGGEGAYVAVDALDQGAGGIGLVEGHVELKRVQRQIHAQGVGGGPGHTLAEVGGAHRGELREHGDAHEDQGEAGKIGHGRAGHGAVDEAADELRAGELQGHRAEQQHGEARHQPALGREVAPKQSEVLTQRDVHRALLTYYAHECSAA